MAPVCYFHHENKQWVGWILKKKLKIHHPLNPLHSSVLSFLIHDCHFDVKSFGFNGYLVVGSFEKLANGHYCFLVSEKNLQTLGDNTLI
jgi:hypothetical protein